MAEQVESRGIFALGDAANGTFTSCSAGNASGTTADTTCQTLITTNVTPTVLELEKTHSADVAIATGPNFPRSFQIAVDVANGETVTSVVVADTIPDEVIVLNPPGADCAAVPGGFVFNPAPDTCTYTADANGGGALSATYNTVNGGAGNDITIDYDGYVQEHEDNDGATDILTAATGAKAVGAIENTATTDFFYDPGSGSAMQPQVLVSSCFVLWLVP